MRLSEAPTIHDTATVLRSTLGRYTEVGARTSVVESAVGDYSYVVNDADIIYATIGKFCSIAAQARINPGNHPFWRASQAHFTYRASEYFDGEADENDFFDWRRRLGECARASWESSSRKRNGPASTRTSTVTSEESAGFRALPRVPPPRSTSRRKVCTRRGRGERRRSERRWDLPSDWARLRWFTVFNTQTAIAPQLAS